MKPSWSAAAVLIMASAALFGCATAAVTVRGTTTASAPTVVAATIPQDPTPTPVPEIVMISDSEQGWEGDLASWAAQADLKFTVVNPSGASAYLGESRSNVVAIVSVQEALDGNLQQTAADGIPIVAIEVPGTEPGDWLSTIGSERHDQAGFLAGVMTGLASQTGWIGQITNTGGPDERAYSSGFTQGLLWGCPKCQMISQTASEMTIDRFRANTVDAVFVIPGLAANEAAQMLAEGNIPMVWVGENGPPSELLIGRLIFEEGPLVILALEDLISTGAGKAWPASIENGTLNLVDINAKLLSLGRQRLLDEAYRAISAGELDIGTDIEA